jgi:hypothetical protein
MWDWNGKCLKFSRNCVAIACTTRVTEVPAGKGSHDHHGSCFLDKYIYSIYS